MSRTTRSRRFLPTMDVLSHRLSPSSVSVWTPMDPQGMSAPPAPEEPIVTPMDPQGLPDSFCPYVPQDNVS